MRTDEELQAAVSRGIAHLDTVTPDWWRRVEIAVLNLSASETCVLGQVYMADYMKDYNSPAYGPYMWALYHVLPRSTQKMSSYLGFDAELDPITYRRDFKEFDVLQELWEAEIIKRQEADRVSNPPKSKKPLSERPNYALLGG